MKRTASQHGFAGKVNETSRRDGAGGHGDDEVREDRRGAAGGE